MRGIDFCPNFSFSPTFSFFVVEKPIFGNIIVIQGFSLNYNGG